MDATPVDFASVNLVGETSEEQVPGLWESHCSKNEIDRGTRSLYLATRRYHAFLASLSSPSLSGDSGPLLGGIFSFFFSFYLQGVTHHSPLRSRWVLCCTVIWHGGRRYDLI